MIIVAPDSAAQARNRCTEPLRGFSIRRLFSHVKPLEQLPQQHQAEAGFNGQSDGGGERCKRHGGGQSKREFEQKENSGERERQSFLGRLAARRALKVPVSRPDCMGL